MDIRTHTGVSLDGYIAGTDGWPAVLQMPQFVGHGSHGMTEFLDGASAAVMGRTTFLPALDAPSWPWPGLRTFVLTSSPLPDGTPADVVVAPTPEELLDLMDAADLPGHAHLVGGARTIQAFLSIGALTSFGIVLLPVLLGDGIPLTPPGSPRQALQLDGSRTFPDGTVEHTYTPVDKLI